MKSSGKELGNLIMLDSKKIEDFDDQTIVAKIQELKSELFKLRFKRHTSGIEKPHLLKNLKGDVARLKTVMNNRKGKQA